MGNNKDKSFMKFMILWAGELISGTGSGLTAFALGVYVYHLTHAATGVALITLCAFLPSVLLNPVGGVLADRFDRRLMMLLGDSLSAVGLIILLILFYSGSVNVPMICVCVTLSSIFTALMDPAYRATVTDLLTEEEYAKASGLVQVAGSAKYLISPILAGFLLSFTDIKIILIIDISTFFVTVFTTLFVKRNMSAGKKNNVKKHFIRELALGWDAIAKKKGILLLVFIMSMVTFNLGFLQSLFAPMVLPLTNSKTLGTMVTVSAAGMIVGSLIISIFNMNRHYVRILSAGLYISGIFFAMMGFTTHIIIITGAGILFFSSLPFVNMSADVLIRKNVANEVQGRAWGIISVLSQLGSIAAYAVGGILADYVFNPLLMNKGPFAGTVGRWIGTGQGRGIGLLFMIAGIFVIVLAFFTGRAKSIHSLEG